MRSSHSRELTALVLTGAYGMHLEPAAIQRDWMRNTDQRFADRCLPLLIANQSGWVLKTPVTVSARWDGSSGMRGVTLSYGSPDQTPPAVSHFGHGILTWQLPDLFVTPPGYNLLVRGPANFPVDGASPLEGVVESDWAAAPATMNWQLTRPGLEVNFPARSPIAMIVPMRRGELESFTPVTADLDSDPSRADRYQRWRDSRGEFLRILGPSRVRGRESWQGDYFRGTAEAGSEPVGPQRRLRLREFQSPPSNPDDDQIKG